LTLGKGEQIKAFPETIKQTRLKMYLNGMGFRAIERVMGVHHTTIINWVRQKGEKLPDSIAPKKVPEVGELDELQTFVGSKKRDMAVDCGKPFLQMYSGMDLIGITVLRPLSHYGQSWQYGNVISILLMAGLSIQVLSPMATKLSARLT
jgi:transposase-like protein